MGETIKEIMYRVFPVVAMHRMGIGSFRLAISLNKYPYAWVENFAMHTERINGGKYICEHCRQSQFTLRWFCHFVKI